MISAKTAKMKASKSDCQAPILSLYELNAVIKDHAELGFCNANIDVPKHKASKFQGKLEDSGFKVWQVGPTGAGFVGLEIEWNGA